MGLKVFKKKEILNYKMTGLFEYYKFNVKFVSVQFKFKYVAPIFLKMNQIATTY